MGITNDFSLTRMENKSPSFTADEIWYMNKSATPFLLEWLLILFKPKWKIRLDFMTLD